MQIIYKQGKNIQEALESFYSKAEIRRLTKQKGIKVGAPHLKEVWIKVGNSRTIILQEEPSVEATKAQIYWEYHYQLMPKVIDWEDYENPKLKEVIESEESQETRK